MFVVSDVLSWYTVNQFVEVVAIFSLSIGFSLLALSMMTTSVSEPHRGLAQVVRDRTGLLEQTKNESEFYLNIWSHEVGNVLQGIILFVEQVAMMDVPSAELPALAETARGLTERASETIRQVSELARIKEQDAKLDVIDLGAVVSESVQDLSVRFLEYPNSIQISRLEGGLLVNADSLLGHLFTYMIRNILARSGDGGCHLRIIAYKKADLVCLEVRDDSRPLPEGAARFLTGEARPMHTEIGLDLFIVRNLMTRYRGRISTEQLESVGENLTVFMFNQTQPSHQ
jgi:light-regulated signal transduction histidine kinase (bacteriophytochrome)